MHFATENGIFMEVDGFFLESILDGFQKFMVSKWVKLAQIEARRITEVVLNTERGEETLFGSSASLFSPTIEKHFLLN